MRCHGFRPKRRPIHVASFGSSNYKQSYCDVVYDTQQRPFNGPLSGTAPVSRYQKGKTNLDFAEARDSAWQWHQLGHMQVCTLP